MLRSFLITTMVTLIPASPLFADIDAGSINSLSWSLIYATLIVAAGLVLASVIRTFGENPAPVGRFQFVAGPDGQDRVLDTKTGRLWERAVGSAEWVAVSVPWQLKRGRG